MESGSVIDGQADGAEHTENDGAGENGGLLVTDDRMNDAELENFNRQVRASQMIPRIAYLLALVEEYKRLRAVITQEMQMRVRQLGVGNPALMQANLPSWPEFQAAQEAMENAVLALVPD